MADDRDERDDRRQRRRPASPGRRADDPEPGSASAACESEDAPSALDSFARHFPHLRDTLPLATEEEYRRAQGSRRGRRQLGPDQVEWLCFELSGQHFALPLLEVEAVLTVPSIVEVPRAPAYLLGVASLRGSVVPVLDLRVRLGLVAAPRTRASRLVLTHDAAETNALLVDRVHGVMRQRQVATEPPPPMEGVLGQAARGLLRHDGRTVVVLENRALLGGEG